MAAAAQKDKYGDMIYVSETATTSPNRLASCALGG
jgi:hypothetical protein